MCGPPCPRKVECFYAAFIPLFSPAGACVVWLVAIRLAAVLHIGRTITLSAPRSKDYYLASHIEIEVALKCRPRNCGAKHSGPKPIAATLSYADICITWAGFAQSSWTTQTRRTACSRLPARWPYSLTFALVRMRFQSLVFPNCCVALSLSFALSHSSTKAF